MAVRVEVDAQEIRIHNPYEYEGQGPEDTVTNIKGVTFFYQEEESECDHGEFLIGWDTFFVPGTLPGDEVYAVIVKYDTADVSATLHGEYQIMDVFSDIGVAYEFVSVIEKAINAAENAINIEGSHPLALPHLIVFDGKEYSTRMFIGYFQSNQSVKVYPGIVRR